MTKIFKAIQKMARTYAMTFQSLAVVSLWLQYADTSTTLAPVFAGILCWMTILTFALEEHRANKKSHATLR